MSENDYFYLLAGGQRIVVVDAYVGFENTFGIKQIFFSILFRIMSQDFTPGLRSTCLQILPTKVIIQQLQF